MILLKIFIFIWIINLLFFKRRNGVLACGLVGYCGSEPADPWKIRLLQLYNLKRGEHATGIYIGDEVFKDAIPANKFLAERSEVFDLIPEAKNFTIIGHDRQASVGSREKAELAHPYDVEGLDKKRLILAHNGTIHNIGAIAQKFAVDHNHSTSSDSWTLAKVMVNMKDDEILELLKGYTGFASLLFTRPTMKNTLFVHRDPDRELFCYHESDSQIYISSILESLYAIGGTSDTVKEFSHHTVYKLVKGKIVKTWGTEERKPITYPSYTAPAQEGRGRFVHKAKEWERQYNDYYGQSDIDSKVDVKKQPESNNNGFYYHEDTYLFNGHPYTGSMWINQTTNEYAQVAFDGFQNFFFVRGIMMRSKEHYDLLYNKALNDKGLFDTTIFTKKIFSIDSADHSEYPVKSKLLGVSSTPIFFPKKYHAEKYGVGSLIKFKPILSNITYNVTKAGIRTGYSIDTTAPSVTQRKVKETKIVNIDKNITMEEALKLAFKHSTYDDASKLYLSVQTLMGKGDTQDFYSDFCKGLVNIVESAGVISGEEVDGIVGKMHSSSAMMIQDALNNILCLYNLHLEDQDLEDAGGVEFSMEEFISNLKSNNALANQAQFINELCNCQYDSLDDLLCDYASDDSDEHTRPVLEAVALELNRMGIIENDRMKILLHLTPAGMHHDLKSYYEMYRTIADKVVIPEAADCCGVEDISIGGKIYNAYARAEYISNQKQKNIGSEQAAELDILKKKLAHYLTKADETTGTYIMQKYGVSLQTIMEEYKTYAGNEER